MHIRLVTNMLNDQLSLATALFEPPKAFLGPANGFVTYDGATQRSLEVCVINVVDIA